MLEHAYLDSVEEMDNDILYLRVDNLLKNGHEKFRYNGDGSILYKSKDKKEIENYLGIKFSGVNFSEVVKDNFDGGEWLEIYSSAQIGNRSIQIEKSDCINKLLENFSTYEDRIWGAGSTYNDCCDEVEKIIKEHMYKVFLDIIEEGFEKINNGNFEWR
ncbi:hypothetical protein [Paenibacillus dendritiformis]|uniref:hypothetical protein n=1 Tax=Paenibacillus dendritiformis TaxID=130049 RepID=UPI00387E1339